MPSSQMTNAVFSLCCHCLSPSPIISLSVSLSLWYALFPVMFNLSWFLLNTRQIECLIIIDRNKLIWITMLFHLGVARNTANIDFLLKSWNNKHYNELKVMVFYLQDPPPLPTLEVGQFKEFSPSFLNSLRCLNLMKTYPATASA